MAVPAKDNQKEYCVTPKACDANMEVCATPAKKKSSEKSADKKLERELDELMEEFKGKHRGHRPSKGQWMIRRNR